MKLAQIKNMIGTIECEGLKYMLRDINQIK